MSGPLALHQALAARGGTLADVLAEPPPGPGLPPGPPQLAASGPRTTARADEYQLLLEMILEGAALHYGTPRVVSVDDPDLALLLGDQLYALGLERLAALEDLEAVAELGDLISLLAQAHVRGDEQLAAAAWRAAAVAVGWGPDEALRAAKALARAQDVAATQALLAAASERIGSAGSWAAPGGGPQGVLNSSHGNL